MSESAPGLRRAHSRRAAVVFAAVVGLSGCAGDPAAGFSTPLAWGHASRNLDGTDVLDPSSDPTIRLLGDGEAVVTDFPQGTSVTRGSGSVCFEPGGGESYTGQATWAPVTTHRFEVAFEGSRIEVSAGESIGPGQYWGAIRIQECGSQGAMWTFLLECGGDGANAGREIAECRPDWP